MLPIYFSIKKTSDYLGVGRTTVYSLIGAKRLKVVKIGSRTLVVVESIHAFTASLHGGAK